MIKRRPSGAPLPEYHDDLLVVRIQPDLASAARSILTTIGADYVGAMTRPETVAATSAVAPALASMERAGLVRQITPLARQDSPTPVPPMIAVARSFVSNGRRSAGIVSGASVVQLQPTVDAEEAGRRLASDPHIASVSRVPIRYACATKKQARSAGAHALAAAPAPSTMWNLRKIDWQRARKAKGFAEATQVKVAVLDTGIDVDHPDLKQRIANYVFEHPDNPSLSAEKDIVGHGTHVAGTISATINNQLGINGICQCKLWIWKIFSDQPELFGNTFEYYVDPVMYQRALADCLDENVDVINLSIGGSGKPDAAEEQLFNALLANDTIVVAAMGNERQIGSPISYPAAIQDVIAVGATQLNDAVANFSNRGNHIAVAAPGVSIWSTLPTYPGQFGFEVSVDANGNPREGKPMRRETDYDAWDGTSMATPHVAAAAALLVAKEGRVGPIRARRALQRSADRVPGMNGQQTHPDFGTGRLNLRRLLR